MRFFNQASPTSRLALIYITIGAFIVVWTGVWYVHLFNNPPEINSAYYWCTGFLVTGLTLIFLGLGQDWIGRPARSADLPAEAMPFLVVNPQPATAAPAPAVAPASSMPPLVLQEGRVLVSTPQGPPA